MPSTQTLSLPQIKVSDVDLFGPVNRASAAAVTVINGADWDAGVKAIGSTVRGYRYSATFLSSLRSNLHLSVSSPISPSSSLPPTPTAPVSYQSTSASLFAPQYVSSPSSANAHKTAPSRASTASSLPPTTAKASPRSRKSSIRNSAASSLKSHGSCMSKLEQAQNACITNGPAATYHIASPGDLQDGSAALGLITDSIMEQRYIAARAVMSHPSVLASLGLLLTFGFLLFDYAVVFLASLSLILATLVATWWFTREFKKFSEVIGSRFLHSKHSKGATDRVHENTAGFTTSTSSALNTTHNTESNSNINSKATGTSKNDDPITIVARISCPSNNSASSVESGEIVGVLTLRCVKRERKAYIRAWTVKSSHRGMGIGEGLLEEGVRAVWGKGARGVDFEIDHANSHRLPILSLPMNPLATAYAAMTTIMTAREHSTSVLEEHKVAQDTGECGWYILADFNHVFDRAEDKAKEKLARVVGMVRRERGSR